MTWLGTSYLTLLVIFCVAKDLSTEDFRIQRHIHDITREQNEAFRPSPGKPVKVRTGQLQQGGRQVNSARIFASDADGFRIWQIDELLSSRESDLLVEAHLNATATSPSALYCFSNGKEALREIVVDGIGRQDITTSDFVPGTLCLNESVSLSLHGHVPISKASEWSTGEMPFLQLLARRVQKLSQLEDSHGGMWRLLEYGAGAPYEEHTDCSDSGARDRGATVIVYLNDMEEGGGHTVFPRVDKTVEPAKGRAMVWRNTDKRGRCIASSIHVGRAPAQGKKYVLSRWYHNENFATIGKRMKEPELPARSPRQPRVQCDGPGQCRWYDSWGWDLDVGYLKFFKQHYEL